jgi:hypothetical protein
MTTLVGDLLSNRFSTVTIAVDNTNLGALPSEEQRGFAADARRTSGDQRGLVLQPHVNPRDSRRWCHSNGARMTDDDEATFSRQRDVRPTPHVVCGGVALGCTWLDPCVQHLDHADRGET